MGRRQTSSKQLRLDSNSEEQTATIARVFANRAHPGDVVLLSGDIGSGKTHFARSLIRHLQGRFGVVEDVPSPTFTLVQTYLAGDLEIWHCDLYRLASADEAVELGLEDAFAHALCLIEWPDRLGDLAPETACSLEFRAPGHDDNHREVILSFNDPRWDDVARDLAPMAAA